ncbi:MAG: phosphoribosylanthranilate isomerase [Terracidiphilus sp.]
MSLWIKICANTTLADAQLAADAGADAVGFVFAPSPRRVTPEQVAAIVPHLPPALEKIGVFVDASFDEIAATVETAGLTGVQLHFDASPELPAQIRTRFGPSLRVLRVVHFDANSAAGLKGAGFSPYITGPELKGALAPEAIFSDSSTDAILADSRTATAVGGTGKAFDWSLAASTLFQRVKERELRIVAAGGLTPENVAEAIRILRPWGVDVVSGVESAPGRKDPAKVRAFIANAREAECDYESPRRAAK